MKPLTEQQRKLAEKNHWLIISFIRRNHLDIAEYYGDLAETYCIAISSYDESKGKLSTYVFVSLGNKLKNIYRARAYEKNIPAVLVTSIDEPVSDHEGSSPLVELLPDRGMSVEDEIFMKMAWEQIHRELSLFELKLLDNIINKEYTQRELAKMYNTSQSAYGRWEKAVKDKARRILFGTPN